MSPLPPPPIPVQRGESPWDVIYSCFQRSFKRTFPFSLVKMYQPRFPSRHFFSLFPSSALPVRLLSPSLALRQSFRDNRSHLKKKKLSNRRNILDDENKILLLPLILFFKEKLRSWRDLIAERASFRARGAILTIDHLSSRKK